LALELLGSILSGNAEADALPQFGVDSVREIAK